MELYTCSATQLQQLLATGQTSSVEIVQALIARRAAVDDRIGAFVVAMDAAALEKAADCDAQRVAGTATGALHGLPLTIKENIDIAGHDSTMGLRHRQGRPATTDAVTVQQIKAANAVLLGKTNVPQLLLAQESENIIWGITHNPWNLKRSPGGSSGGEAAAIASGQSPMGIGTDIGGSIRIPCHFCGIAGLKPTVDRWSNRGSQTGIAGQELVRAQMGPMARKVADLALLMRAVDPLAASRCDPAVPPLPAPEPNQVDLKGLRVGITEDDGFLSANPAIVRAVREAKAALQAAGATVVDFCPPTPDLLYVWLAGISSDGGATLRSSLGADPVARQLINTMKIAQLPGFARALLAKFMRAKGDDRMAKLLDALGEKSVATYWQLTDRRTQLRRAEFDAWNAAGLDAVVCPPHALPAMPLGTSGDLTLSLSYAFRYVMLNFPAGVVPVTRVKEGEAVRLFPRDRLEIACASAEQESEGLPVGVQVAARPYREDVVLAVMQAIETGVQDQLLYPRGPVEPLG